MSDVYKVTVHVDVRTCRCTCAIRIRILNFPDRPRAHSFPGPARGRFDPPRLAAGACAAAAVGLAVDCDFASVIAGAKASARLPWPADGRLLTALPSSMSSSSSSLQSLVDSFLKGEVRSAVIAHTSRAGEEAEGLAPAATTAARPRPLALRAGGDAAVVPTVADAGSSNSASIAAGIKTVTPSASVAADAPADAVAAAAALPLPPRFPRAAGAEDCASAAAAGAASVPSPSATANADTLGGGAAVAPEVAASDSSSCAGLRDAGAFRRGGEMSLCRSPADGAPTLRPESRRATAVAPAVGDDSVSMAAAAVGGLRTGVDGSPGVLEPAARDDGPDADRPGAAPAPPLAARAAPAMAARALSVPMGWGPLAAALAAASHWRRSYSTSSAVWRSDASASAGENKGGQGDSEEGTME